MSRQLTSHLMAEQLLGLDEDDCRIFLQQISERGMDEEAFISELQSVMGELHKAKLDIPQAEVVSLTSGVPLTAFKSSPLTINYHSLPHNYHHSPTPHL